MALEKLTGIQQFDFQINRIMTYGGLACDAAEVRGAAREIYDLQSWFRTWFALAQQAEQKKRHLHAAYYYRLAEFFLSEKDKFKEQAYNLALANFNKIISQDKTVETAFVPYQHVRLKTLIFQAPKEKRKLVVFGGYDSFIEEFYLAIKEIVALGYTVYLFEGPGQGSTLKQGLHFDHQWEKPVGAVLDYFNLDDVAVIGISWGGYLALRAAAFEKRIQKVVAYNILYDGFDCMTNVFPPGIRQLIKFLFFLKQRSLINSLFGFFMRKKLIVDWAVTHGMHITGTKSAYDFYTNLKNHTLRGITEQIACDVLLLAGEADHYIPLSHYHILMKELVNARSLQGRIFTAEEGGEQHCQVGNHRLAINYIHNWLQSSCCSSG